MKTYRLVKHVFITDDMDAPAEGPHRTLVSWARLPSITHGTAIKVGPISEVVQNVGYVANEFTEDEGEWELLVTPEFLKTADATERISDLFSLGWQDGESGIDWMSLLVSVAEPDMDMEDIIAQFASGCAGCGCGDCGECEDEAERPEFDLGDVIDLEGLD